MGVKTPICVYSSDEGKSQPLDTLSTHFGKHEVEHAASSCRKRRRQRGEGGALPWKLSGAP